MVKFLDKLLDMPYPNNEIFNNFAVQYKLIDILDLLVEFNVDFNCCYLDYSSIVSHDYLEVFSHLEKHGCLFQKAKYCNINLSMLPYSYTEKKKLIYSEVKMVMMKKMRLQHFKKI